MLIGINARYLAAASTGLGQFSLQLCRALLRVAPHHRYLFYVQAGTATPALGRGDYRIVPISLERGDRFDRYFTEDTAFMDDPPDILHATHLTMPVNSRGVPTLLTIHDIIPAVFMRPGRIVCGKTPLHCLNSLGITLPFTAPSHLYRAALVATHSRVAAEDIHNLLHYKKEIPVIPLGADPDLIPPPTADSLAEVLRRYKIRGPYLLNFGGLAFRKNIKRQIEAFCSVRQRHPELSFVIIGEGYWQRKLAHKKRPGVVFTGHLSRNDLRTLLHGALFSSYMSLYEGFGLPVLESLSCGIPVLTSAGSSMAEILPERLLLSDPRSISAMARAMEEMIENQDAWKSALFIAREEIAAYSWEKTALRYLELYRRVRESHLS